MIGLEKHLVGDLTITCQDYTLILFSLGSHVASCDPITTSYAAFPRRNCTHMVEIPVPFNPEGKTLVREILALVGSVPEARLEEQ